MAERETRWRDRTANVLRNPGLLVRRLVPGRLHHLLEAFWMLPLALSLLGVVMPLAFQTIDEQHLAVLFGGEEPEIDVDGARSTLSVVAGGVITITSLVFSLAFVALSITAQQLSPRVLDYVVEERTTQVLVGLSLSTFLFSAITLSFGITGGEVRLAFSAFVALTMAAATLSMVVVFSHRMTRILRAEDMVVWLGRAFSDAIRRGPQSITDEMMVTDPEAEAALECRMEDAPAVLATATGYLGAIDYPGVLTWAQENDLMVDILLRENAFVLQGQPVARVAGAGDLDLDEIAEQVTDFVNLTERRVIGETPAYEGSSLSEVALRALSPGINDPATARSCANRLYEGLVILAGLPERPRALKDGEGVPRILRARQGIPEFLENDVAPIVEAARDRMTLRRLRELNETLSGIVRRPKERAAIEALLRVIAEREIPAERYLGAVAEEPPPREEGCDPAAEVAGRENGEDRRG
jgi:uncharacterized membrane protein